MMGQDATAKARLLEGNRAMCTDLEIYGPQRPGDCKCQVREEESQPCPRWLEKAGVETFGCPSDLHWASLSHGN